MSESSSGDAIPCSTSFFGARIVTSTLLARRTSASFLARHRAVRSLLVMGWRSPGISPDKVEGATTLNLEHERARQAKASADKLEMENAERRGILAPVDQMALVWGALLGNLKNRLLGMGAKLGSVIAPESRAPVCQTMIDGEIHEALIDLADYDPGTDLALIPGAGNGDTPMR